MNKKIKWDSNEFHFIDILFHLAVVTGEDAVGDMEVRLHRLVVRDALGVVAFHEAVNLVRCNNRFLLYHLVVADDTQNDVGGYDGESRNFIVGEELVRHLDDTFVAYLLRRVVDTDGDGGLQVEES